MKTITPYIAVVALGAHTAYAQDTKPETQTTLSGDLRYALDREGLSTQNLFTVTTRNRMLFDADGNENTTNDLTAKFLLGTTPNDTYETGLDLTFSQFRFNLGYENNPDSERGHLLAQLNKDWGFLGTSVYFTSDNQTVPTIYGAYDLNEEWRIAGTFDTEGNVRGVIQRDFGRNGLLDVFVAYTSDDRFEGGFSYNREKTIGNADVWINARFGDRPLDLRLIIGDTPKRISQYWSDVTGNGVNDLGDLYYDTDHTFKFDIGQDVAFDFFGPESKFLGEESGSTALELRLQENNRFRIKAGHRLGNIGFLENVYVAGGTDFGLENFNFNDAVTPFVQTGADLDQNTSFHIKAQHDDENGVGIGAYLNIRF